MYQGKALWAQHHRPGPELGNAVADRVQTCEENGLSKKIKWKSAPKATDYAGAKRFLTLLCSENDAEVIADRLVNAAPIEQAGKDLLRAAGLTLLSKDDPRVRKHLKDIQRGKSLPPVLLVRGDLNKPRSLVIADGYHRICASYIVDENALISCRLVDP